MSAPDGAVPSRAVPSQAVPAAPSEATLSDHPAWARLQDQLGWYDKKSSAAQRTFKRLKVVEIIVAAAVPVVAGVSAPAALTASLGATVVVLESVQQLFQWQTNWVLYRSTAEALKHEKFLFLASAGPYARTDRNTVLAERLEGLISQEHAKWADSREEGDRHDRPTT